MRTKSSSRKFTIETLEKRRLFAGDLSLIKDLNTSPDPWPIMNSVSGLTVVGDLGFFANQDASTGREIWRTDGTAAGTYLLKDIAVGAADSNFYGLTRVGNQIYFAAESPSDGTELWVTDGSTAGTRLVADLNPGSGSSNPNGFQVIGNDLFFTAYTGAGVQVAKTDGISISLLGDPSGYYESSVIPSNNYFLVNRFDSITGLFSIDPITGVEQQLSSIAASSGAEPIGSQTLVNAGGILLTDGTIEGTSQIPVAIEGSISFLGVASGRWLVSSVGPASSKLWSVSPDSSVELIVEWSGAPYAEIFATAELDGKVVVMSQSHGALVTDGTMAGTQQVHQIPSAVSLYPIVLGSAVANGAFFVRGYSEGQWAFWRIDATTLASNQVGAAFTSSSVPQIATVNGDLYWNVNESALYRSSDGVTSEIVESEWYRLADLRSLNNSLVFTGIDNAGAALRKYSGIPTTELSQLIPIPTASSSFGHEVARLGDQTFFAEASGLWRTDGTEAGTVNLINSLPFDSVLTAGNTKVFILDKNASSVWVSDGTALGTSQLLTLPGDDNGIWIMAVGDSFIVGGAKGVWFSDGTLAGTVYSTLNAPSPGNFISPSPAIIAGGRAYFTTSGEYLPNVGQMEYVWSSDATLSGTTIVREGPLTRWWSAASEGNTIVFSDGSSNLWRSDDGLATLELIARRQPDDTSIQGVAIASGVVYFARYDGLDRADVFRVSGNANSPTLIGNVASPAKLHTLAGEFYLTSAGDARVYRDNPVSNSLEIDEPLSSTAITGWGLSAGPSYILAPAHFPEFGIELGRLDQPVQVALSNRWIAEDAIIGDVVGSLKLNWTTAIATFSLVNGDGDTNNRQFLITGSGDLVVNGTLDYEQSTTSSVRVRATSNLGTFEKQLIILIGDVRDSVDEIQVSKSIVAENSSVGTPVGVLSASPSEPGLMVSYSVIAVDGQTTSLPFAIVGNELRTASVLDFEARREYLVTVRAVDSLGRTGDANLTVIVANVNENATSAIRLSNDIVEEGDTRVVGQLFVPNSSDSSWVYSLSSGQGDYDNQVVSIEGDQLSVVEIVDYETRDSYSVHVTATNASGDSVSAALTIDITPVDEFSPLFIELIYLQAGAIEENTPVGTPVIRLEVEDADRGDNYQFLGTMSLTSIDGTTDPYLQIVGNEIVVVRPINFENIVPFSGYYSIIATAASGQQIGANGDTIFLRDVNDPPILSRDVPDQEILANESTEIGPSFYDEDQFDSLTFSASLSSGSPLPSWATLDPLTGRVYLSPTEDDVGTYSIVISAIDTKGASTSDSFNIEVVTPLTINGTAGNDSFTASPSGANQWTVRRNGSILFQGSLATTALKINGSAGDDQFTVSGTTGIDNFEVSNGRIISNGAKFYFDSIESRTVRGLGGGDLFAVNESGTAIANASSLTSPQTTIIGGAGRDTVRATGTSANFWMLTDDGAGSINGVSFVSISNLVGNANPDYFSITRRASLNGTMDGAGGYDQLEYVSTTGDFDVVLNGSITTSNSINQISGIEMITSNSPTRSSIRSQGGGSWTISGDQVTLGAVEFRGFRSLGGSNSVDDQFRIRSLASTPYEIIGGQGQRTDSIVFEESVGWVNVDLQTQRINDLIQFTEIERFETLNYDSSFTGPNRNTDWNVTSNNTVVLSSGEKIVGFRQLVGNSRNDRFVFQEESGDVFSAFSPGIINGGGGDDKIETFVPFNTNWQIEQPRGGQFQTIRFANVEHLASKAAINTVNFLDVPTSTWIDSITGTGGPGQRNQLSYSSQSNALLSVNLQTRAATGVGSFSGFNVFSAMVPNSRLRGRDVDTNWQFVGTGFLVDGASVFENFQSVIGGGANDTFQINSEVDFFAGLLDGGAGRNTLNYSLVNGIHVDLAAGQASYFPGGIANVSDVIGSAGDDLIFGNAQANLLIGGPGNDTLDGRSGNDSLFGQSGDDLLIGGFGNDLLVGGFGSDQLLGGANSDLLIANTIIVLNDEVSSSFVDPARVDLLMSVWGSNASYTSRVNQLTQGVGPGRIVRVIASNLGDDSAVDTLHGGDDDDWFVADLFDLLSDRLARERLLRK